MDISKLKTSRKREQQLEHLSQFELKDNLITLASDQQQKPIRTTRNAGRGKPNGKTTGLVSHTQLTLTRTYES